MPEERAEKTIGAILREARTVRNISVDEASKRTRIHPNILRSMEGDDFSKLGPVYGKSFLKMYADFLGCDRGALLKRLEGVPGPKAEEFSKTVNVLAPEPAPEIHGVFVKAQKRVQIILRKVNLRFLGVVVGVIAAGLLLIVLSVRMVRSIKARPRPAAVVSPEQAAAKKSETPAAAPVKPALVNSAAAKQETPEIPAAVPKQASAKSADLQPTSKPAATSSKEKVVLVIRAKDKCWVQVKVDGKVVFENVLVKGAAETWQAQERIDLWLGNAGVVQLELNGRLLERIGRPGQTLRNVVITRSGLVVRR